jgi:hypothetical protein
LYRNRRVNGRPVKEYLAADDGFGAVMAEDLARLRRVRAKARTLALDAVRVVADQAAEITSAADPFDRAAGELFRLVMSVAGYRQHHRGEWRRTRSEDGTMGKRFGALFDKIERIRAALDNPKAPKPSVLTFTGDTPEVKALLERAAAGDRSAVPEIKKLLDEERYLSWMGEVADQAESQLIRIYAGDNLAVQQAAKRKAAAFLDELLGPTPTMPQKLLARRCVNNCLVVHALEVLMAMQPVGGPAALAISKQLSMAERRLHAALRSLAVLRLAQLPAARQQINMAAGPMVVNN